VTFAVAITIGSLISALEGQGPDRDRAIEMLSDTTSVVIRTVLDSANWRGRDAAVTALGQSEPPRVRLLIDVARHHPKISTRRSAIRGLGGVGPVGTCDSLATMFGQGSDSVILDVMGSRQDCQVSDIEPFLNSNDPDVRRRAFVAFSRLDPGAALLVSTEWLGDSHHGVRRVVSTFLVGEGMAGAEVIARSVDDLEGVGKTTALNILGELGGEQAVRILSTAISDPAWVHRRAAADGLARIGSNASLRRVRERRLAESHPLVLEALERAVLRIEGRLE
jgi:HEAT repeat protein